jgi:hypothetical protein
MALVAAAIYLSFELGRYQAGYSKLDERRQTAALQSALAGRDQVIEELRRQQAIFETSREIDRATYDQIETNLDQLQARIQAQEEELAFYRGIVSPNDGVVGLRIQDLEVLPANAEGRHLLRLILVQAIVHSQRVSGTVRLRLSGTLDDDAAEFDLAQLVADGEAGEIAYGFRYFQSLEQDLVLPVGFEPDTVVVEIQPREPRGESVTRSFQWAAVQG